MGLATLLTEHCLAVCRERGVQVVALNASELGRAVYEKLGFESSGTEMRLSL
jgi:GNAT superfamily N-acetyltransferase